MSHQIDRQAILARLRREVGTSDPVVTASTPAVSPAPGASEGRQDFVRAFTEALGTEAGDRAIAAVKLSDSAALVESMRALGEEMASRL